MRSLGLPVTASHVSVFSLFRMPLGAFQRNDQLYVYDEGGRLSGLARVERDANRDEWTIVELDAVGQRDAGDIRFRLVQHLMRDGSRRGASRFHVACADADGNVELFMQAGFARYGEETILFREPGLAFPSLRAVDASELRIRPATNLDSVDLARLYKRVTPHRWRASRATDCLTGRTCTVAPACPERRSRHCSASPTSRPWCRSPLTVRASRPCSRSAWPRNSSRTTCA